jgi:hypothetical protein
MHSAVYLSKPTHSTQLPLSYRHTLLHALHNREALVQAAAAVSSTSNVSQTVDDRSGSFCNESTAAAAANGSDCDEDSEGIEGKEEEGDSDGGNNSDWENPSAASAGSYYSAQKELLPGPRGVFSKGSDDRCVNCFGATTC